MHVASCSYLPVLRFRLPATRGSTAFLPLLKELAVQSSIFQLLPAVASDEQIDGTAQHHQHAWIASGACGTTEAYGLVRKAHPGKDLPLPEAKLILNMASQKYIISVYKLLKSFSNTFTLHTSRLILCTFVFSMSSPIDSLESLQLKSNSQFQKWNWKWLKNRSHLGSIPLL